MFVFENNGSFCSCQETEIEKCYCEKESRLLHRVTEKLLFVTLLRILVPKVNILQAVQSYDLMVKRRLTVAVIMVSCGSGHTFLQPRLMTIAPAASPQKSVGHV